MLYYSLLPTSHEERLLVVNTLDSVRQNKIIWREENKYFNLHKIMKRWDDRPQQRIKNRSPSWRNSPKYRLASQSLTGGASLMWNTQTLRGFRLLYCPSRFPYVHVSTSLEHRNILSNDSSGRVVPSSFVRWSRTILWQSLYITYHVMTGAFSQCPTSKIEHKVTRLPWWIVVLSHISSPL